MKNVKQENNKPDIFTYQSHTDFLRDWLAYLKRNNRGFSLRKLAQSSQLASGYLPMILSGKRDLSSKALARLIPNLQLTTNETKVLELLHTIGTTENQRVRMQAIEQLTKLQPFKQKNQMDVEVYRYLTKWHYVAIREMALLKDFDGNIDWIQSRLGNKISKQECQEALQFLTEKGFIQRDSNGRYSTTNKPLSCRDGVFKASLGEFHRQMMELGAQSIDKVARNSRYILGHTLAIQGQDFEKVRQILDEAVLKLEALGQNTSGANEVYHIELASFPLTKVMNPQKSEEGE